jgi:hypothetical protein
MRINRNSFPALRPPRPAPIELTADMPAIKKLPPGVASGTEQRRYSNDDPDHPAKAANRRLKVTITCPKCGPENVRMLNRTQLKNARIKCDCGASVGFQWSNVRRG